MCVIMIAQGVRPTPEMVAKAYSRNDEGAGVAWREKEHVKWVKGLEAEELQKLIAKLPMPFIMHCRKVTVGGDNPALTHPFIVDPLSPLNLTGRTPGYVMFHNGTWHQWKDRLYEAVVNSNTKLPGGRWSDSRAIALVASIYGVGVLDLVDEKTAIISPTDLQVFGKGWVKRNDVICSNDLWESEKVTVGERTSAGGSNEKTGGSSHQPSFRGNQETVRGGEDKSEGIQASTKEVPEVIDDSTVKHSLATEQDRIQAIEWVRSLNHSPFRAALKPDTAERDNRIDNARKGIVHLGKL